MEQNPALTKHFPISPADLERLEKDPSLLTMKAKKILYVQVLQLNNLLANPNVPLSQRLQAMEFLAKVGGGIPRPELTATDDSGSKFSVNIILSGAIKKDPVQVIEATTVEIDG